MERIKTNQENLNWTKLKKCQIYFASEIMTDVDLLKARCNYDGIRCVARLIKTLMLGTPTVKIDNNQHIEQACSTNRNISIDEWKTEENLKYVHKDE